MKENDDGLNAARGVIYALVLSIPFWAGVATAIYYLVN